MRAPTAYEMYLLNESIRYGGENTEDNDYPMWLVLEEETYRWIESLCRSMFFLLNDRVVSKHMLERVEKIPTIRFLRYRDISPNLKKKIQSIAAEFSELCEDLKKPEMWERQHLLSKQGLQRWKKATKVLENCCYIAPDPEWRESWVKQREYPRCTRLEAERIVFAFLLENAGIDLNEIDCVDGKHKYYGFSSAKDGIYRLRFGTWGDIPNPFNDIGIVEVDMLTREAKYISIDTSE